jgi:hypothetical protein
MRSRRHSKNAIQAFFYSLCIFGSASVEAAIRGRAENVIARPERTSQTGFRELTC